MIKQVVPALLGVLALSLPVGAQQTTVPEQTSVTDSALNFSRADAFSTLDSSDLIHSLPMLGLLDGRRFPISGAMGRMGMAPLGLFPAAYLSAAEVPKVRTARLSSNDTAVETVSLRAREYYYGGEAGVFYGKSTGKYGGEAFGTYAIGTVGNDKFQITAGASYEESTLHFPRSRYWLNR